MEKKPKISICVPVYNTGKYLDERFETFESQTFTDYEVIIIDGFSDDGSWEKICEYAQRDKRVKAFQLPPKGVYDAFNKVIEKATGEYIYLATSDDTAEPELLEELSTLLDKHPDCGIAQCSLQIIGPNGELDPRGDYWEVREGMKFLDQWLTKYHKRHAPYDCYIGLLFNTIYTSMTQILIRKEVFDKVGNFPETYGSFGDHNWHLKASMLYSSVYSPKRLATWRKYHDGQASDPHKHFNFRKNGGRYQMAMDALNSVKSLNEKSYNQIHKSILHKYYLMDSFKLKYLASSLGKIKGFFNFAIKDPKTLFFILKNQKNLSPIDPIFLQIVEREMSHIELKLPEEI